MGEEREEEAMATWLEDLSPEICLDLLAASCMGRLGVMVDGVPEIFPVNHTFDWASGCVIFPTNTHTKFEAAMHWPKVCFEADGLAPDGRSGWSVMVIGQAELVVDIGEQVRAAAGRFVPWSPGEHAVWVKIRPERVTGRRISVRPNVVVAAAVLEGGSSDVLGRL
jgi:nitroimidazol reductase NimA-like FMN-containing flavoprotein (pyridoxamine 5'-phosphate oxidase superfamily)